MPEAADILARLDAILGELQAIRAEIITPKPSDNFPEADDLADGSLIEISQAVELFNRPADSLRWMCRKQGCGQKIGGRWMASPARIRRHLNGG